MLDNREIALFGHTGFVGESLKRAMTFKYMYNRSNLKEAENKTFDVIVCAAMPAEKWRVNQSPQVDLDNMEALMRVLKTITCRNFVLISTIDVYKDKNSKQSEQQTLQEFANPYGHHRYLFEQFVREHFNNHHVVRLPALFGIGLKKNYIFDLLNCNCLESINRNSAFQWYDISLLPEQLDTVVRQNMSLVDLFPEPIETEELYALFYEVGVIPKSSMVGFFGKRVEYNRKTAFGHLFHSGNTSGYIMPQFLVLQRLKQFASLFMILKKTSVCSIAFKDIALPTAISTLKRFGIDSIELAPAQVFRWEDVENRIRSNNLNELVGPFKEMLQRSGLRISSFQGVLYGKQLNVFEDPRDFVRHMKVVAALASSLKETWKSTKLPIVFGSPKNRRVPHSMAVEEAKTIFCTALLEIAATFRNENCIFCVEANATDYGCNFITNSKEASEMVRLADNDAIRLHFDTGCATLAGEHVDESIRLSRDILCHIHISEPSMKPLSMASVVEHKKVAKALTDIHFEGERCVECLCDGDQALSNSLMAYSFLYSGST